MRIPSLLPLSLAVLFLASPRAEEAAFRFQAALDANDLRYSDASSWPPVEEGAQADDPAWVRKNIGHWLDRLGERGVGIVSVTTFDRDGNLFMTSPALKQAGFRETAVGDLFEAFCANAKRRGVAVNVLIEDIGHILNESKEYDPRIRREKLTHERIAALVRELGGYARRHGIEMWVSEEAFDDPYLPTIRDAARAAGLSYMHFFHDPAGNPDLCMTEDYGTYPRDLANREEDRRLWRVISAWNGNTLGTGAIVFGSQAAFGKPAGVATSGGWGLAPGCEINVALYRAFEFRPAVYAFYPGWTEQWPDTTRQDETFCREFNYTTDLEPLLVRYARPPEERRPIGNLILCAPKTDPESDAEDLFDAALLDSIDMITNTLSAAGYDLRVTFGTPLPEAELTYVLAIGGSSVVGAEADLPIPVAERIEKPGARVVLQVAGVPRSKGSWPRALRALGWPTEVEEHVFDWERLEESPIPEFAEAVLGEGTPVRIRYRGTWLQVVEKPEWLGRCALYHHRSDPGDGLAKDTVVRVRAAEGGAALVTERSGKWFVTGSAIHFEFSNVLANLLSPDGPVFLEPTYAYVARGPRGAAVFAADDTSVRIRVPGGRTVVQWSETGKAVESPTVQIQNGVLEGRLGRWHLAIVTK